MAYLFRDWEVLMRGTVSDETTFAQKVSAEIERIRLGFLELLCSGEPRDSLLPIIRAHQQVLLEYATEIKVATYHRKSVTLAYRRRAVIGLFETLEPILADFWQPDVTIPWFAQAKARERLDVRRSRLKSRLNKAGVDPRLIMIILHLKEGEKEGYTFGQYYELWTLVDELERLPREKGKHSTENVVTILLRHRLQNPSLLIYLTERTRLLLLETHSSSERLAHLEGERVRVLESAHRLPSGRTGAPDNVTAQYTQWLNQRIREVAREPENNETDKGAKRPLLKISLSGPELALLIRLMVDTDVLKTDDMSEVARLLLESGLVRKSHSMRSVRGFYNLIFNSPATAISRVGEFLEAMRVKLHEIQKSLSDEDESS